MRMIDLLGEDAPTKARKPKLPPEPPEFLYHGASVEKLKDIIESDTLLPSKPGRDTGEPGVSLTSLVKIASFFAGRNSAFGGVVLELRTADLIAAGYDIRPFAKAYTREKEWRCYSAIRPLKPALNGVYGIKREGWRTIASSAESLRKMAKYMSREGKWAVPEEDTLARADFLDQFDPHIKDLLALKDARP